MTTRYPLPDAARVKALLGVLYEGIAIKAGGKPDRTAAAYFAVYVADDGKPVALCGSDILFAANASAALSMLPPPAARDMISAKRLSDEMLANFGEIMNICARLLITDTSAHLKLSAVHEARSLPADAAALLGAPAGSVEFEITFPRYGGGRLSVISA